MSAAPGWYDAGVAGRLRWWDGTQWTEHEADVPAAVIAQPQAVAQPVAQPQAVAQPQTWSQPVAQPQAVAQAWPQAQAAPAQAPAPRALTGPPMGWYPTPAGPLRWWDGVKWTGLRVKDGVPGTDWATAEQPAVAWAFGAIFAALALAQLSLGLLTPGPVFSGAGMLILAVLWFLIAAQSSAVSRIPAPVTGAVVIDAVQPLPGFAEAAGAGWYPVAPRTSRWWTGARWSQYAGTAFGVRPTFHGARAWRNLRILIWALLGLGILSIVIGITLTALGATPPDTLLTVIGVGLLIAGIVLAGVALLMLALSGRQRRILLPPEGAPSGPPLG